MRQLLHEAAAFPGVYKANFQGEPMPAATQKRYKRDHKSKLGTTRRADAAKKVTKKVTKSSRAALMRAVNNA
jgi:hypothetical protein